MASTILATPPSRDIYYSCNFSTAPLPLIPRRHVSAPSSRRVSPVVAPVTDLPPSGILFAHASPPTIPASDCTSAPVHILPPTLPSDTKAGQSSTVSFPLALHPRQNPSINPFLHGDSAANAFLPSVLQNSRLPHLPRQIATMTLLPHPERAQLSSCHAIYLNHMSMLLPLQRSHEVNKRHHFPGKSRVSPSSRH
ncbi:hypothetical protein BJV77DRAFT_433658 [Russula vinacea]|nr:hypothetical protein BJV77DRAFT_433658 [Russula vinacea]